jgi:hypothetical protein
LASFPDRASFSACFNVFSMATPLGLIGFFSAQPNKTTEQANNNESLGVMDFLFIDLSLVT